MVIAIGGIALYIFVILREVPGAAEERIGAFEDLPANVNQWEADETSPEGKAALAQGQRREVRLYFAEQGGKLLRQVRYRNIQTDEIERAEPDEAVKRKRVRR